MSANAATTGKPMKGKKCSLCDGSHMLPYCAKFKALTVVQRNDKVKEFGVCSNYMRAGHRASSCPTEGRCLVCADTLLHGGGQASLNPTEVSGPSTSKEAQGTNAMSSSICAHAAKAENCYWRRPKCYYGTLLAALSRFARC